MSVTQSTAAFTQHSQGPRITTGHRFNSCFKMLKEPFRGCRTTLPRLQQQRPPLGAARAFPLGNRPGQAHSSRLLLAVPPQQKRSLLTAPKHPNTTAGGEAGLCPAHLPVTSALTCAEANSSETNGEQRRCRSRALPF